MKKGKKKYFALLGMAVLLAAVVLLLPERRSTLTIGPARFSQATVVVDAGHGGEDGGAVSPNGTVESNVNLAIAQRLDQLLGLYGVNVRMLRDSDISLHDSSAETLRQKKVSDYITGSP